MQYGNSFLNQIELPMLFYALIAFILITKAGDVLLFASGLDLCSVAHRSRIHTHDQ